MKSDAQPHDLADLAEAYEHLGRYEDVVYVLDTATRIEYPGSDYDRIAWAIWRARIRCRTGDAAEGKSVLEKELAYAESIRARDATGELLTALALVDLMEGHISSAFTRLDASFSIGREIKSAPAKAHALSAVGIAYTLQEDYREAWSIFNRASLLHQRTGDRNSLSKVYNNIGVMLYTRDAHTESIPFVELGLEFGGASPDIFTVIGSLNNNIRVYEDCYQIGAGHFREAFVPLLELLPDPSVDRFGDSTMLPARDRLTAGGATYKANPFIREAVLLLSMQPTRYLGLHS